MAVFTSHSSHAPEIFVTDNDIYTYCVHYLRVISQIPLEYKRNAVIAYHEANDIKLQWKRK